MTLAERNELRMQIWELDQQRQQLLSVPEPYRSADKIQRLTSQIDALEVEIMHALVDDGSS